MKSSPTTYQHDIVCPIAERDVLMAQLESLGFEGFWEDDGVVYAYSGDDHSQSADFQDILAQRGATLAQAAALPNVNWNQEWEASFPPLELPGFLQVVPNHHAPQAGFPYTLRIQPKMAFGTGHHPATQMVMRLMQPTHWQGKRVLDVGCGTGILGLLAGLLGAQEVALLDYDPLSTENAAENLAENPLAAEHCQFAIIQGELNVAPPGPYDVLLANINRNIHLEWGAKYRELLKPGGEIYLSGVLTVDSVKLLAYFSGLGFEPLAQLTQDDWWAAQLKRI